MFEDKTDLEVVTLVDEDENEVEFAILTILEVGGGRYAVLSPVEHLESEDPELDLYAFTYAEDGEGNLELDAVEDDELLDEIMAEAERILFGDDEDEDEDEDEDDEDDEPTA